MENVSATIRDGWLSYRRDIIPANAPAVQVQECRRAFYAGAHALLCIVTSLGDDSVPEDAGVDVLAALHSESQKFADDVKAGRL